MLVVEAEGELVSSCLSVPGEVWFGEDQVPHAAVGGVATLPEYRNHGYAGAMMAGMVRRLRQQGYLTSCLWPFSFAYYRKFGWEVGACIHTYTVPSGVITGLAEPGDVVPFDLSSHLEGVMALYDRFARSVNLSSVRDRSRWMDWLSLDRVLERSEKGFVVLPEGDRLAAYGLYTETSLEEGKRIRFRELVAEGSPERNQLIAGVAKAASATEVVFSTPVEDRFLLTLRDPWAIQARLHPAFSFLVTDPPRALLARTPRPDVTGRLAFEIADPVEPAQPIRFTIEAEKGHITLTHRSTPHQLSMPVQSFSQLYAGCLRAGEAVRYGKLKAFSGQALALFDSLFAPRVPFRSSIEPG